LAPPPAAPRGPGRLHREGRDGSRGRGVRPAALYAPRLRGGVRRVGEPDRRAPERRPGEAAGVWGMRPCASLLGSVAAVRRDSRRRRVRGGARGGGVVRAMAGGAWTGPARPRTTPVPA